jgi:hypothetical protein
MTVYIGLPLEKTVTGKNNAEDGMNVTPERDDRQFFLRQDYIRHSASALTISPGWLEQGQLRRETRLCWPGCRGYRLV